MCHEVSEINGSVRALTEKLRESENAMQALRSNLSRIEEDLRFKNNSLALDNRCMDVRQKLKEIPHSMMYTREVSQPMLNASLPPAMPTTEIAPAVGSKQGTQSGQYGVTMETTARQHSPLID